ncbi:hypothetical protein PMIN01_11303 [Paraphaeosphaeria minitans]|uniref:Uncharacterized protein n=1 Tax=Paraphaeosphaeria minitans TaxID=565426 RepID=A0A9P6KLF3_9PLEO|nr:hypothetical protein PMIN01_11303 [Paraphaeosphaeria minitans]
MMQNVPVPNGVAPGTFETAEALTSLTTIGVGQQHHPPRRTSILVDPNHTELHSIVTPGRLRGTIYFEAAAATMAQDNLGKFLSTIQQDPARAAVVRSVKLDQFYDNFENSELAEVFNEEIWPTYAFTDENSDEIYPPVLNAALYMKGIQRRAVNDPIISQDPLCPTDLTRLDKVIQPPALWCPPDNIPFQVEALNKWKVDRNWELEIKEHVQGDPGFVRPGKKNSWSVSHIQHWMDRVVSQDIVRNG